MYGDTKYIPIISFLNSRQNGMTLKERFKTAHQPNFDHLLSKMTSHKKDVHIAGCGHMRVPPLACKFRRDNDSDLLSVANEDGQIVLYDTLTDRGLLTAFRAHDNAIFDVSWFSHKNKLVTAGGDHITKVFDMVSCTEKLSYKGHTSSIKSVDTCPGHNDIFASGSRDGNICVWDMREKKIFVDGKLNKPSIFIHSAHSRKLPLPTNKKSLTYRQDSALSSVSAVAFQDEYTLASAGSADGVLKIWDLRKTYIYSAKISRFNMPRNEIKYSNREGQGCTCIFFDSSYKKLYGCSTSNEIYQFDCHSYSSDVEIYSGFRCNTYFVKAALSLDDQYILSGSSDNKAYVWKVSKPGLPMYELPGHIAEVTAVAWSPNNLTKLVTCGDDSKICIWRFRNPDEPAKVEETEVMSCALPYTHHTMTNANTSQLDSSSDDLNISSRTPPRDSLNSSRLTASPGLAITRFFTPLSSSTSASASPSVPTSTSASASPSVPTSTSASASPSVPTSASASASPSVPTSTSSSASPSVPTNPGTSNVTPVSPTPRSPCKTLNNANVGLSQNEISSKSSQNGKENAVSVSLPTTSAEGCSRNGILSNSSQNGKENEASQLMPSTSVEVVLTPVSQMKRKSSESSICKYHPEGCGRTKGHKKCGKKVVKKPSKYSITAYFTVSPPST